MIKNDGGPAFPVFFGLSAGMSLRDWFAGQALITMPHGPAAPKSTDEAARWAYEMADAMLAVREQ
jgi:hypothetical protein